MHRFTMHHGLSNCQIWWQKTYSTSDFMNYRYFTWAAAGPYLASLILFRKPLSDETLHQLSAKDSRQLSDRSQTQEQPTRFGALSRWLRGSPNANQLSAMEQGQPRRPSGSDEALPVQQPDEVYMHSINLLQSTP